MKKLYAIFALAGLVAVNDTNAMLPGLGRLGRASRTFVPQARDALLRSSKPITPGTFTPSRFPQGPVLGVGRRGLTTGRPSLGPVRPTQPSLQTQRFFSQVTRPQVQPGYFQALRNLQLQQYFTNALNTLRQKPRLRALLAGLGLSGVGAYSALRPDIVLAERVDFPNINTWHKVGGKIYGKQDFEFLKKIDTNPDTWDKKRDIVLSTLDSFLNNSSNITLDDAIAVIIAFENSFTATMQDLQEKGSQGKKYYRVSGNYTDLLRGKPPINDLIIELLAKKLMDSNPKVMDVLKEKISELFKKEDHYLPMILRMYPQRKGYQEGHRERLYPSELEALKQLDILRKQALEEHYIQKAKEDLRKGFDRYGHHAAIYENDSQKDAQEQLSRIMDLIKGEEPSVVAKAFDIEPMVYNTKWIIEHPERGYKPKKMEIPKEFANILRLMSQQDKAFVEKQITKIDEALKKSDIETREYKPYYEMYRGYLVNMPPQIPEKQSWYDWAFGN